MSKKAKELARIVDGELSGDGDVLISGVNGISEAREHEVAFIHHERFAHLAAASKAGCIVIPRTLMIDIDRTVIKVDNPSIAFSTLIDLLLPDRIPHPRGIHPAAIVAKGARVGDRVSMGPYVVVEDGAVVGDDTILHPFTYIGHRAALGRRCVIFPNVTVREGVTIGDRVVIHAGSCIGSDGFGYDTRTDGTHVKIPQLGTVVIEDDVEIGSCVTVDRARLDKTVIGKGSKIDNLVQIAHNVVCGPYCLIAAQSGISGSTRLGRNVVLAGQVGVADHVTVGDFVVAGAKTGISKSFPARTTLFGYPARPVEKAREMLASLGLLPRLFDRVRALEAKLKELEEKR